MTARRVTHRRTALAIAAMVAAGALAPDQAQAVPCTWNPASGNWGAAANWSCAVVPGINDDVAIAAGKAVTVDAAQSARSLTNAGSVLLDAVGLTLSGAGSSTNTGTLSVGGAGAATLLVNAGHSIANTGGSIVIGNGSVLVQAGSTIGGGTLGTSGSGRIAVGNSAANVLSGVTLNGSLDLASATGIERIVDGLTLNGTVAIGANSIFAPQGDQTIGGSGAIVFADANGSNRFNVEAGNLVLGPALTVRGGNGVIGNQSFVGGAATLANHGTIQADVAGTAITLAVSGATTNHGTLAALNGGTLILNSSVAGVSGSQILAGAGSTVLQNGVTLSGDMNLTGAGSFRPAASGSNMLSGVTLSGTLDLATAYGIERVAGGLTLNDAVIRIGSNSILAPQGAQTIGGTGQIVFVDGNGANRLNVEAGTLTLAPGITVRGGDGIIGQQAFVGGAATLVNQGLISADTAGRTITIGVAGSVVNQATLRALDGGTLALGSMPVDNSAGTLLAGNGGTIAMASTTVSGGQFASTGSGRLAPNASGSNFLNGVTVNGLVDLASNYGVLRVSDGGMVLNGTLQIGANSIFAPQGTQTLSGSGTIVFADDGNGANRLNVEAGTLTIGPALTVRGGNGIIGQQAFVGGAATLVNQGLVSADTAGRTITIGVAGSVVNQATLRALDGGTLALGSMPVDNSAGTLLAGNGGTITMASTAVSGGQFASTGSGRLVPTGSGSNYLNGVTVNGLVDLATSYGVLRVTDGGMVLNGTLQIGANSIFAPQGTQTLSGSGAIVFADANGGNRLNVEAGALTLGPALTVRGVSGVIGQQAFVGGAADLTNLGTIRSDGGGTIAIANNGTLTNAGLFHAQAGALAVQRNVAGSGTLQVDAAGAMTLANGGNTQGRLVMGGPGAALNVGNANLTITGDYTNDAAGSGNSFNRRAGVSGAGQIVAGGDVAQVLTGAQISGGATPNATLTIQNTRVGANHFAYQIANTGTTGPTLRGALQTSVNGANLTDPRLSGAGVTAGNYNAGAPGQASGARDLVFTVATAGPLAPLSGQVLNLRSNFENQPDQKLSIVLGNGAAAYNPAQGSTDPAVALPNQRVGGNATAALTVANSAPAGAFSEDLNVALVGTTGQALASGAISGRLAGTSNTGVGSVQVGVDTSAPGARSGTAVLNFETAGAVAGVGNGLGTAPAGSQTVTVGGNVYQPAAGALQAPVVLNFGVVQVGQSVSQDLVVRNVAAGPQGFVEDLNASFGASSGVGAALISGSGSFSGIAAGSNSSGANGTMTVSVNTAAAGVVDGAIAINYFTAGAINGASNGLGVAAVGSEAFGVAGTIQAAGQVVNQASPLIHNPVIDLGAVRVGAAAPTALVIVSNQATVAPQAALNATIASNGAPIGATGAFALLAPGATDNGALQVSLATGTAGNFTGANAGSATVAFVSDATNQGCTENCQLALPSQTVSVAGKVYTPALGQLQTPALDFGIVRVGDTVSARNITIRNGAAVSGLNDTLRATLGALPGPFTSGGSVDGIAAQDQGQIAVGVDTSAAGVYSHSAGVSFASHNADMADTAAGADGTVAFAVQVNNLADAAFARTGGAGTLTRSGADFVLDLGSVVLGHNLFATLSVGNAAGGPADELRGLFDLDAVDDFSLSGWNAFGALGAGDTTGGLAVDFTGSALGLFEDSITLTGWSSNASDPQGLAVLRHLLIRAQVIDDGGTVPEPGALWLTLLALGAAALTARHRRAAARTRPGGGAAAGAELAS